MGELKFFVTFGQKYRQEPHPNGGHPDGWFEVEAESYSEARGKTANAIGNRWAFIYAEPVFDKALYPLGKLAELSFAPTEKP